MMSFDFDDPSEQLRVAAQEGKLDVVRRLLADGADIDSFDEIGKTALHYAVREEHFDVVEFLLHQGADVNANDVSTASNTALADVAATCSLKMAQRLLDAGADPTIPGWMGLNALDRAAKRERGDGVAVYDLLARAKPKKDPIAQMAQGARRTRKT